MNILSKQVAMIRVRELHDLASLHIKSIHK